MMYNCIPNVSGYLKKINGKEPESIELQKRFADVNLTQDELSGMVNKFIECVTIVYLIFLIQVRHS